MSDELRCYEAHIHVGNTKIRVDAFWGGDAVEMAEAIVAEVRAGRYTIEPATWKRIDDE